MVDRGDTEWAKSILEEQDKIQPKTNVQEIKTASFGDIYEIKEFFENTKDWLGLLTSETQKKGFFGLGKETIKELDPEKLKKFEGVFSMYSMAFHHYVNTLNNWRVESIRIEMAQALETSLARLSLSFKQKKVNTDELNKVKKQVIDFVNQEQIEVTKSSAKAA